MVGSSGYKGISRIDSPKNNTFGWYVRVQFAGQTHSRFFSDSAHGGEQRGLAKAVRHRNQLERSLGKPRTDRTVTIGSARNRSGVQGVKRVAKGNGFAYEVTWSPQPGVVHRTTVSIQKFGEDEAFRRACRTRQLKERKHYGGLILKEVPEDLPIEKPAVEKTLPAIEASLPPRAIKMRVSKNKNATAPITADGSASIESKAGKNKDKKRKSDAIEMALDGKSVGKIKMKSKAKKAAKAMR
jgi:hypothetical protein